MLIVLPSRAAPLPAIVSFSILTAVRAFPSPVVTLLDPASVLALIRLVVERFGKLAVMVFRESVTGVHTGLAVVVGTAAVVVARVGKSSSQRREQERKKKYPHCQNLHYSIVNGTNERREEGESREPTSGRIRVGLDSCIDLDDFSLGWSAVEVKV